MGKFIVEFSTDNAAFCEPDCDDGLRFEVAEVLRRARVKVTGSANLRNRNEDDPIILVDSNGARVGIARYEEE